MLTLGAAGFKRKVQTEDAGLSPPYIGEAFDLSSIDSVNPTPTDSVIAWTGSGYGFSNPVGLTMPEDGARLYTGIGGYNSWPDGVSGWILNTEYDITSRTTGGTAPVEWQGGGSNFLWYPWMVNDGSFMFCRDPDDTSRIARYDMSTPYDFTGISDTSSSPDLGSQIGGFDIDIYGLKLFVVRGGVIYEWEFGTPFDPTTLTYTGNSFNPSDGEGSVGVVKVSDNGLKLYTGRSTRRIVQHSLASEWTLDGASNDGVVCTVTGLFASVTGIAFGLNSTRMILMGGSSPQGVAAQYDGSIIS